MKNKSIVIICGDPKSTFNEILIKTFKNKIFKNLKFSIIIVGSKKLLEDELKKFKIKINLQKLEGQTKLRKNNIYVTDVPLDTKKLSLINKNKYISKSFDTGLNFLKKKIHSH